MALLSEGRGASGPRLFLLELAMNTSGVIWIIVGILGIIALCIWIIPHLR